MSSALWRNMASKRKARLHPSNSRLPWTSWRWNMALWRFSSSLQGCNAGHNSFTLQQMTAARIGRYWRYTHTYVWHTGRRGLTEEGRGCNEWKIPSRLTVIYSTHVLYTSHRSLMYSAVNRNGGLCVRLSAPLPSLCRTKDDFQDVPVISIKIITRQQQDKQVMCVVPAYWYYYSPKSEAERSTGDGCTIHLRYSHPIFSGCWTSQIDFK